MLEKCLKHLVSPLKHEFILVNRFFAEKSVKHEEAVTTAIPRFLTRVPIRYYSRYSAVNFHTHTQSKYLLIFGLTYNTGHGACSGVLLSIPIIDQFIFYRYTGSNILIYLKVEICYINDVPK